MARAEATLKRFALALLVGGAVTYGTTTIDPAQGLQVGKNLVQYFVPGLGWFVDANTATLATKTTLQNNGCNFIDSQDGGISYTYTFGPTCQTLAALQRGQRFWLVTKVGCPAACTLRLENFSPIHIKRSDGSTDPTGQFDFTQGVPIWYDGTIFRIEWQH